MPFKPGTVLHRYTEKDFESIAKGIYLPNISVRSQQYAYERFLKRQSDTTPKHRTRESYNRTVFTPQEDLQIMEKNFPTTHSLSECKERRRYLKKNFVEVGWGSLIGTQIIHW